MRKKACIVKRGNGWAVKQPLPDGRSRWRTVGPRKRDAELLRDEINRRVALGALYPSEPLEPYGNLIRFACLTGLRQGELFALREGAIDLERRSVLVEAGAREGQLVPTKTTAGRRKVSLSAEALRILREQLLARAPNE